MYYMQIYSPELHLKIYTFIMRVTKKKVQILSSTIFLVCAVLLNIYLQHESTVNLSVISQSFLGRTTSLYQLDALSK